MDLAGELVSGHGLALGVVVAAFLAGLRHGFDIDHIAAISDITSSQPDRRKSLVLATIYALGHMLVLVLLGLVAVVAGRGLPDSLDAIAGRAIGLTLVALGVYVFISLVRFRRDFRIRSRWMLVTAGVRWVLHRVRPPRHVVVEHSHEHPSGGHHATGESGPEAIHSHALATKTRTHDHSHTHVVPMPPDPFVEYGPRTSFIVGMVHGVGAETPTQVLLFSTAAGVAGTLGGIALLAAFVLGLLIGNSILAVATAAGFTAGRRVPYLYMGFAALTALVSIYVGTTYVLQRQDLLPAFLGG